MVPDSLMETRLIVQNMGYLWEHRHGCECFRPRRNKNRFFSLSFFLFPVTREGASAELVFGIHSASWAHCLRCTRYIRVNRQFETNKCLFITRISWEINILIDQAFGLIWRTHHGKRSTWLPQSELQKTYFELSHSANSPVFLFVTILLAFFYTFVAFSSSNLLSVRTTDPVAFSHQV